jgi:hypothetical protein
MLSEKRDNNRSLSFSSVLRGILLGIRFHKIDHRGNKAGASILH